MSSLGDIVTIVEFHRRRWKPPASLTISLTKSLRVAGSLYNNQTITLPYQPYRYAEYNVCDDTCESDLNDHFGKILPDCKYHSANEFNTCDRNP